jgi:uncharacterized protein (DUF1697 family)
MFKAMPKFVALLRGINVGGNKLVPMAQLRRLLESFGFEEVRTLLQSGNVVFRAPKATADSIEAAFKKEFGFESDIAVIGEGELLKTIERNPFPDEAAKDPSRLLATFFRTPPDAREIGRFCEAHPGPEQLAFQEGVLYTHYPNGIGSSKLILPFRGTARNWNTVLKISAALDAMKS